jgi:DNA uptake protein ComE-like DNA-binding protein
MICAADQVDINTATADALVAAFGLDPDVAGRLIKNRPYLAPRDLSVVEGIGPGALAEILASGKGCATPTTSPPPAPSPCDTTNKVDLQSATAVEIANVTGLNRNAAERIVEARPFAVLGHVSPERVPGVGKGILEDVIARSCLTPQPIRTSETSWRWAYPAYETTVERDGYALSIPSGVIDDPAGAWGRITPLPSPEPGVPGPAYAAADMHIEGDWEGTGPDGQQKVVVTVPQSPYVADLPDPTNWEPYLQHDRVDGTGENVDVVVNPVTGQLSAHLSDLSVVREGWRKVQWATEMTFSTLFGNRFPSPPSCESGWTQRPGTNIYDTDDSYIRLHSLILDLPGNVVSPYGFMAKHCVQNGPFAAPLAYDSAQTKLLNNTGTITRLSASQGAPTISKLTSSFSPIVDALTGPDSGDLFLGPGEVGASTVHAGATGTATLKPQRLRTFSLIFMEEAVGHLFGPDLNDPTLREMAVQAVDCTFKAVAAIGGDSVADITRELSRAFLTCFDARTYYITAAALIQNKVAQGVLTQAQADSATSKLLQLRELVKFVKYGRIFVDAVDAAVWGVVPYPIRTDHYIKDPTVDGLGRRVEEGCINRSNPLHPVVDTACQDARYHDANRPTGGGGSTGVPPARIIRTSGKNAYLYRTDTKGLHPIGDGGTYICLANHYAVDWNADYDLYYDLAVIKPGIAAPATCDPSIPRSRRIGPSMEDAVLRLVVPGDAPDPTWIVQGGVRYPISSGEAFGCWVEPETKHNMEFHVWDYISGEELDDVPLKTSNIPSNCGDPSNPRF